MSVTVLFDPTFNPKDYASVPISFVVCERFLVSRQTPQDFRLSVEPVEKPYVKDYDACAKNGPASWTSRFDTSYWKFFGAFKDSKRVGSAAVAYIPPELDMLEGRSDIALIWDIRVAPDSRANGVGKSLLAAVETWALSKGVSWLKVETQDINVPACRFYQAHGFHLRSVVHSAYAEYPSEVQFLWYKRVGHEKETTRIA